MPPDLILRAVPQFGPPHARRYAILSLGTREYFTGNGFSNDWTHACLYSTPTAACFDMQKIMRAVYGDVSRTKVARWLHQASILNIRTHEYGNGPRDSLVLPVIHWGLIEEIDRPVFALESYDDVADEHSAEWDEENNDATE